MNFSFTIKALIISFFSFMIIYSISFISSQKLILDSNNYGIKNSVKKSINVAEYRKSGDITFDKDTLINSVLENYIRNNNINVDDITFEIYVNENTNVVTVKLYTSKDIFNTQSNADYIFSYQVKER
ncbi:MAG: hypothetical protein E7166_06880 [Firmicutes bacterium]|nr:hypothetical protein [Bacillota bacterium]